MFVLLELIYIFEVEINKLSQKQTIRSYSSD
jgi:hypothetical protein